MLGLKRTTPATSFENVQIPPFPNLKLVICRSPLLESNLRARVGLGAALAAAVDQGARSAGRGRGTTRADRYLRLLLLLLLLLLDAQAFGASRVVGLEEFAGGSLLTAAVDPVVVPQKIALATAGRRPSVDLRILLLLLAIARGLSQNRAVGAARFRGPGRAGGVFRGEALAAARAVGRGGAREREEITATVNPFTALAAGGGRGERDHRSGKQEEQGGCGGVHDVFGIPFGGSQKSDKEIKREQDRKFCGLEFKLVESSGVIYTRERLWKNVSK